MSNLYNIFQENISDLDKVAIVTKNLSYTFKDIHAFSAKYANLLSALNIRAGDCVAAQLEKSEHNLFLYLACLRSGIIFLPLNNAYSLDELKFFLEDARPKLVVCDPKKENAISDIINLKEI